jgi:hypothetical protein
MIRLNFWRKLFSSSFKHWFLEGQIKEIPGPHGSAGIHAEHPWYKVMCLTGVDYFSTLGYQPGIAFLAAGVLSPIATFVLILLTLLGALPIYKRVAASSPHGEGSISMLEHLLPWWKGKLFVLCLLGFVATDFIITITLSAADATAHIIENPFTPEFLHHPVGLTLILIALLGAIFLKGFGEAIGLAVFLVVLYLSLNSVVIGVGLYQIWIHPEVLTGWKRTLFENYGSPWRMGAIALLLFPKLALGLSGFETGVAVMPLVQGDPTDTPEHPSGRIRNTQRLLTTAALIMSVMLITSSLVTTMLIPPAEFQEGGAANGRALAYLAHQYLGKLLGTTYDVSTILILWFAGASAMAGLLNIVPRYLPRYGMAPEWTRAPRPLAVIYTVIAFTVTILFDANVNTQGGAYATGVLVLMTSAAIAVTLSVWQAGWIRWAFLLITLIFGYTTLANIVERPEGIKIASFFIGSILVTSLISRLWRMTELRVDKIELDELAQTLIQEVNQGTIRVIANQCDTGDVQEYRLKEQFQREFNHMPTGDPILFFEVEVRDASEFTKVLRVRGVRVNGYRVLRAEGTAVPNAIAAFLLYLRDKTGKIPHVYFEWAEGNPIVNLFKYLIFGEGDTAPVTHEVLRRAEPNPEKRPRVHVSGC